MSESQRFSIAAYLSYSGLMAWGILHRKYFGSYNLASLGSNTNEFAQTAGKQRNKRLSKTDKLEQIVSFKKKKVILKDQGI